MGYLIKSAVMEALHEDMQTSRMCYDDEGSKDIVQFCYESMERELDKLAQYRLNSVEEYDNWIDCSIRLPEEKEVMFGGDAIKSSEMVWVALENGSEMQAHLEDGRWYSFGGYLVKEKVIAWHPAYKPPRYRAEK